MARLPPSHPLTKGSIPDRTEVDTELMTRWEDIRLPIVRVAIAIIISEKIANFIIILISMHEVNGMVVWLIVLFVDGRRMKKRSSLYGLKERMGPFCHEDSPRQPILLHHLARMMLMIEIIDDAVTMTVEIVMVIEEITEDVEVVEVVDKYIGIKTKVRPVLPVVSLT